MIKVQFDQNLNSEVKRFAHGFVSNVLQACDPAKLLRQHIDFDAFTKNTHILAFGKASLAMATECAAQLGTRCGGGVVLAPEQFIREHDNGLLHIYPADHPLPTLRNIQATQALVDYARSIPMSDQCIVCISGGGSAHLCSPSPGFTLDEIIETTGALNAQGADIRELNQRRRSMETLKNGGLARLLVHVDHCEAIVLSDVLGNDLETIASGPMYSGSSNIHHHIIGDHHTALHAASQYFQRQLQLESTVQGGVHGAAIDVGREFGRRFRESSQDQAHLIGGETTVRVSFTTSVGGPALEVILSTAIELTQNSNEISNWVVIGLATDGIDGPSEAAGAVVTSAMMADPIQFDRAHDALKRHDTLPFLDSIGSVFWTGPTGTNLNDVFAVCRWIPS